MLEGSRSVVVGTTIFTGVVEQIRCYGLKELEKKMNWSRDLVAKCVLVGAFLGSGLQIIGGNGFAQSPMGTPNASSGSPTTVLLWPKGAPGNVGDEDGDKPSLTIFLPSANPTGAGVIIAPGGGYSHLSMQKEGEDVAHWLNDRGLAAFVLKYRLGPRYHHPIELWDVQRAVRLVRASSEEYALHPDRVGIWGFSAGGHLAASAATASDGGLPSSLDPVDRQSSRPDFLVLAYPVITMELPYVHKGSRDNLLANPLDPVLLAALSVEKHVTSETAATFLFATTDDKTVPVMNSVLFYSALIESAVPAELHLYQHGPHGVGLAQGLPDLKDWPELLAAWMRVRGYMSPKT